LKKFDIDKNNKIDEAEEKLFLNSINKAIKQIIIL
jgi:hypothetical protein